MDLLIERDGSTATVAVNRPAALNALTTETIGKLGQLFTELKRDDTIRVVILTGVGPKAFIAGADVADLMRLSPAEARVYARAGQNVCTQIERLGKPTIAAVNGFALGGGCEFAMACSLRIAADTAIFGQPEILLGLIPGFAGTQRLPRLIGKGRALEWLLTGAKYNALDALRVGLANRVVPANELMGEAKKLAAQLANNAAIPTQYILDAVDRGLEMPFENGECLEATLFGLTASTRDMREGVAAFLEKRAPTFTGE
jgi:enoyl-CoA hydratase